MYEVWGLPVLYDRIDHASTEEREHASMLIRRMLFLESTPEKCWPTTSNSSTRWRPS
jgi:bacterioferritin